MIKLLIFDIGGVIIDFTEAEYIFYISDKLGLDVNEFAKTLDPMIDQMELGKLRAKEAEFRLSWKFKIPEVDLEWVSAYKKLARLNNSVASMVSRLSRKYPLVLLTNISASRYLESQKLLRNVRRKRTFTSYHLHLRKPDSRIYRHVLKTMRVKPQEAVFIDNMLENVYGAKRVGINAVLFTRAAKLKKDLAHFGVHP